MSTANVNEGMHCRDVLFLTVDPIRPWFLFLISHFTVLYSTCISLVKLENIRSLPYSLYSTCTLSTFLDNRKLSTHSTTLSAYPFPAPRTSNMSGNVDYGTDVFQIGEPCGEHFFTSPLQHILVNVSLTRDLDMDNITALKMIEYRLKQFPQLERVEMTLSLEV